MSGPLLGAAALVVVALISFVGARLTSRDTRKASREAQDVIARIDERKVDLDEFREFKLSLQERIADLEADLAAEREARRVSDERAAAAEARAEAAERRAEDAEAKASGIVARLTQRVAQLERAMREASLPVPPSRP